MPPADADKATTMSLAICATSFHSVKVISTGLLSALLPALGPSSARFFFGPLLDYFASHQDSQYCDDRTVNRLQHTSPDACNDPVRSKISKDTEKVWFPIS